MEKLETYIELNDVPQLFKKYEDLLTNLDNLLDILVGMLNDLKLVNPDIKLNQKIKIKYNSSLKEFCDSNKYAKNIILVGSGSKLKGIELPEFNGVDIGNYKFGFMNQEYHVVKDIESCEVNFDGYIEIRKSVYTFNKLITDVLEFRNFLFNFNSE